MGLGLGFKDCRVYGFWVVRFFLIFFLGDGLKLETPWFGLLSALLCEEGGSMN